MLRQFQIDQIKKSGDQDPKILAESSAAIHEALNRPAVADKQVTSRDAWGGMLHSMKTALAPEAPEGERLIAKEKFLAQLGESLWDAVTKASEPKPQIYSEFLRERNPEKKLSACIDILASVLLHNVGKKQIDLSGSKQASPSAIQNILNGDWNALQLLIIRQKLSPNSVIGPTGVELFDKHREFSPQSALADDAVLLVADSTLLMLCSILGHRDLVNLLLASGALRQTRDSNGFSARDYAVMATNSEKESSKQPVVTPDSLSFSDIDWKNSENIGNGSFCRVFRACLNNGTHVAIKQVKNASLSIMTKETLNMVLAEVATLESLHHRNIVRCFGSMVWFENGTTGMEVRPIVVFEYVHGGTLANALAEPRRLIEVDCRVHLLEQVADALKYMHSFNPPMTHRDLKPANILLTGKNDEIAKVTDIGLTRVERQFSTTPAKAGTMNYRAPETWHDEKGTHKVDVYSYGILMWATIARDIPWKGLTEVQIKTSAVQNKQRPQGSCFQQDYLNAMYIACVHHSPYKRPAFQQISDTFKQKDSKSLTMTQHAKAFSNRLLDNYRRYSIPTGSRRSQLGITYLHGLAKIKIPQSLQTAVAGVPCKGLGISVELSVSKMSESIHGEGERLNVHEAAAICLYTSPGLFGLHLNQVLRSRDRNKIIPYLPYLRLLFHALEKLPVHVGSVWRGVKAKLPNSHPAGTQTSWWAFSSATLDKQALNDNTFMSYTGQRSLFHIKEAVGVDITR